MVEIAREICPKFELTAANRWVLALLFDWCLGRPAALDPTKGLWLWGPMGTGKSTLLRIVRQFCYEYRPQRPYGYESTPRPYWFDIVPASDITDAYSANGPACFSRYINNPRLAIDDLGTEQKIVGHYGVPAKPLTEVLQRRYDHRLRAFTHVTTNFCPDELLEHYGLRVVERIPEMFNLIELDDYSHRPSLSSH